MMLFERLWCSLLSRQLWRRGPGSIDRLVSHEVRVNLVRAYAGDHFPLSTALWLQVVMMMGLGS